MEWTGGCLCGAVRYEAGEPPDETSYCHCRMCQKAYDNVFSVAGRFREDTFRFTRGAPKVYRSSEFAERGFCANCGTPLILRYLNSGWIYVLIGSLDHPENAPPEIHRGVESQIPWLNVHDDLPRKRTEDDPEFIAAKGAADQGEE